MQWKYHYPTTSAILGWRKGDWSLCGSPIGSRGDSMGNSLVKYKTKCLILHPCGAMHPPCLIVLQIPRWLDCSKPSTRDLYVNPYMLCKSEQCLYYLGMKHCGYILQIMCSAMLCSLRHECKQTFMWEKAAIVHSVVKLFNSVFGFVKSVHQPPYNTANNDHSHAF